MKMTGERACVNDRSFSRDSILSGTEDSDWTVGHLRAEWQVPGSHADLVALSSEALGESETSGYGGRGHVLVFIEKGQE